MCPFQAHVTLAPLLTLYIFTHCHLFVKLHTVLGRNEISFFFLSEVCETRIDYICLQLLHYSPKFGQVGKCSACGFKRTTAPSHRRSFFFSLISLCFHFDLSFFPPPSLYCYCLAIDTLSSSFSVSPDVLPFALVSYLPPSNSFVLKHSFTTFPHLRSLRPPSEPALALCPYTHLCLPFECFQRPIKQRLGRARHTHLTPKTHRMKEGYQIPLSMPDTHTHTFIELQVWR